MEDISHLINSLLAEAVPDPLGLTAPPSSIDVVSVLPRLMVFQILGSCHHMIQVLALVMQLS